MGAADQGISAERWAAIPRSLCFIRNGDALLLLERAKHKRVFPGRYNGIGGHIERDEDPLSGARREIREETGLRDAEIQDLRLRGVLHIDAGESTGIIVFVFSAEASRRAVIDGYEGTLHWVTFEEIDALPLVDDLPPLLARLYGPEAKQAPFYAHVHYDAQDQRVTRFSEED